MFTYLPTPVGQGRRKPHYGRLFLFIVVAVLLILVWKASALANWFDSAFAFLFGPTGWDIAWSILPYTRDDPYWWAFLVGLTNTISTGLLGIIGATIIGFFVGTAPLMGNKMLGVLAQAYVDVFRNIPLVLQLLFWYTVILHLPSAHSAFTIFGTIFLSNRGLYLPKFADTSAVCVVLILVTVFVFVCFSSFRQLANWHISSRAALKGGAGVAVSAIVLIGTVFYSLRLPDALQIERPALKGLNFAGGFYISPELAALLVAIIFYRAAFMGEIFRGGFTSTARGHIDAAISLGLRPWQILWKVRLPLALVHIIPPLSSEYINIVKVTAVGIFVGFADLFMISSNAANQTGRPLQVLLIMVVLYLSLNWSLAGLMNALNRRVRARGFD